MLTEGTATRVNSTFISEKVSRIRWIPEQYDESSNFITTSWDLDVNNVKLWKLVRNDYGGGLDEEDENEFVPRCTAEICFTGDISGLEFVGEGHCVVSNTEGFVSLIALDRERDEDQLQERFRFENLHRFDTFSTLNGAPCTALSVHDTDVATVGEDGRLNVLSTVGQKVLRSISGADSCTISCVAFLNPKEVLTGNRLGIIKCFDIRAESQKPTGSFAVSCEDEKRSNSVTCLAYHPTQRHIILAGSEEGSITVWDLRQPQFPASYLKAHEHAITELAFHRTQPSRLFSASEGGELWQWNQNTLPSAASATGFMHDTSSVMAAAAASDTNNPWLNGERAKSKIAVTSLLSGIRKAINSFDSCRSKVICGGDNEAIYLVENVV
ncbi:nucleoporin Nup43 [Culex quinquefasciatus]|uniref:nucleoporin Nup43 n=1 Tax=Culex quinquefasciatus TaxID=7176 RepID=UPI0018E39782|nr:nucleoporin Nup43 [Culex quinquefasciatus]